MYFISITRLRLRSFIYLPRFLMSNSGIVKQLLITPGFIAGKEMPDKGLVFWTVTVWKADADMKVFRNSAVHRKAMQKLPVWCDEASYAHWLAASPEIPTRDMIYNRMMEEGKLSKVRYPSPNQVAKNYPPIKWTKIEQVFTPQEL